MHINMKSESSRFLRRALLANAAFSAISGGLMALAEPAVLSWLGLEAVSIRPIGFFLLAFSAYLLWMACYRRVPQDLLKGVILGDWAWVAGSALLLLLRPGLFSWTGMFLVIDIAIVVSVFALLQGKGLKRASEAAGPAVGAG